MADDPEIPDLPGRSKADVAATIVRAGVSSVPVVGGAAAELFDLVLAPSLERRRDEWLRYLGEAVEDLRERLQGFDPRDLEGNERFVSTVLAASTVAMKTHQREKLAMLRNAIVSSVLPGAPDDYEQQTFLRFVDELTPLHVRMLALFADPARWFERHPELTRPQFGISSTLGQLVVAALPELTNRRDVYDAIAADLEQRRLGGGGLHTMMSASGAWERRATRLGRRFLDFVLRDGDAPAG